jgi:rSAM/selenodomain-associated transferase 2
LVKIALEQTLTIVMPTLNTAQVITGAVAACTPCPVVVADGGSADATRTLAEAAGARVVQAPPGRGTQLAAGAAVAETPWMLFLHADTRLAPGWPDAVRAVMARPDRAAYARFILDDPAPQARRLERLVAWRCRVLALPYGDQGLLISRALYDELGGFRPLPLMEDVDLVRRLGRRRLTALPVDAVTSAARWRRDGWWCRSARNLGCLGLYFLGLPPTLIRRLYG